MNYDLSKFSGKTVGIIGLGYIGSHLKDLFDQKSKELEITVVTFNRKNVTEVMHYEFDYFFNCAGNTGDFRDNLIATIESNIGLTTYLLSHLKIKNSYVGLSSTRVYGFSNQEKSIFKESDAIEQQNLKSDFIYDGAKALMESIVVNHGVKAQANFCCVRLSNIIGPLKSTDLNDATFFKLMLKKGLNKDELLVKQSSESKKDYLHLYDALKGIILCATEAKTSDVFNIAFGKSFSIYEITKALNVKANFMGSPRASYSNISTEKAKKELGFNPQINIENITLTDFILEK